MSMKKEDYEEFQRQLELQKAQAVAPDNDRTGKGVIVSIDFIHTISGPELQYSKFWGSLFLSRLMVYYY